jgi:DNA end-binding protein Ku
MARPFWKGSVSFGLVEIPVSLRPAVQDRSLSFTLLDREDFSPVGYRRYNKATGEEVPWERVVKGYEYEPDEYVALTDEELKRANLKASQTIEIVTFVKREDIDPIYFDTPYYVEPLKSKSKSFALLKSVLEKTDRVGVANVVLRTRQHPAALLVRDDAVVLNLLRHADQLEEAPPRVAEGPAPTARELSLAMKLVESMHGDWDPEGFKDEYRADVLAMIEKKVKAGETHTIVEGEEESPRRRADVVDLMPLLQKSIGQGGRRERTRENGERPARSSGRLHAPGARSPRRTVRKAAAAGKSSARERHGPRRATSERRRRA